MFICLNISGPDCSYAKIKRFSSLAQDGCMIPCDLFESTRAISASWSYLCMMPWQTRLLWGTVVLSSVLVNAGLYCKHCFSFLFLSCIGDILNLAEHYLHHVYACFPVSTLWACLMLWSVTSIQLGCLVTQGWYIRRSSLQDSVGYSESLISCSWEAEPIPPLQISCTHI